MDFVCTQDFFKPKSCETYSYHWSAGKSNLVETRDCELSTFTFFCLEDETKYNAFWAAMLIIARPSLPLFQYLSCLAQSFLDQAVIFFCTKNHYRLSLTSKFKPQIEDSWPMNSLFFPTSFWFFDRYTCRIPFFLCLLGFRPHNLKEI